MNRREALGTMAAVVQAGGGLPGAVPDFWQSRLGDIDHAVGRLKKGRAAVLVRSPGQRPVYLVRYGPKPDFHSRANYNSACGGNAPPSYARKDGTQPPVVLLLGPVHGGELEGIVGLLNFLSVAETGQDLRGQAWPDLARHAERCRVLVVPSGNPDGRARCPFDCWIGRDLDEDQAVEMGLKPDGSSYHWPGVKQVHPMKPGDYRRLGTYFNDDGVNLMHDEWSAPLAAETRAYLRLARQEAPDWAVSLHSHASEPSVEPTAYVPQFIKETIEDLGTRLQHRYAAAGLPHRAAGPAARPDGVRFPPPSFNLCSALHHACGAAAFVHETCNGVRTRPYPQVSHAQLLDIQLLLYDELFRYAVEHPVRWVK